MKKYIIGLFLLLNIAHAQYVVRDPGGDSVSYKAVFIINDLGFPDTLWTDGLGLHSVLTHNIGGDLNLDGRNSKGRIFFRSTDAFAGGNIMIQATQTLSGRVQTLPNLDGTFAYIDGGQTFTSAVWNGTKIAEAYGGTNQSTYTTGDMLYASATNTLSKLADVATGQVLTSGGVATAPAYSATPTLTALTAPNLYGSSSSGGSMTLNSTSHASKGNILFGTSAYDEVNNRIGLLNTSPQHTLSIIGTAANNAFNMTATNINTVTNSATQATDTSSTLLSFTNSGKPQFDMVGTTGNSIFHIDSSGSVGIGTSTPATQLGATQRALTIKGASSSGVVELETAASDIDGRGVGNVQFTDVNSTAADKRVASINGNLGGVTANNRGGTLIFYTKKDNTSGLNERARIDSVGNVGIGTAAPSTMFSIAEKMNVTSGGLFTRINGITVPATEHWQYAPYCDTVSRSGETATVSPTNLNNTSTNGVYRVSVYIYPTTAGTSGTVTATIKWNDGAAESAVTGTHTFGALGTPVFINGQICTVTNSTAITWETTVTAAVGSPIYVINVVAERLF